jgi:hypothetical protein
LPDGVFSNQKSQFWVNLEGPWNGKGRYIIWPFGTFHRHWGNLVAIRYLFPLFDILCQEKSGNPASEPKKSCLE